MLNSVFVYEPPTFKAFDSLEASYDLPTSVDWRNKSAVTPVKNQGNCGNCWALYATGAVERISAIKYVNLTSLSEQQLIDCSDGKYGNDGCNGGWMNLASAYIKKVGGIQSTYTYHYTDDDRCNDKPKKFVANITGIVDVPTTPSYLGRSRALASVCGS
jgi:C1A family cysteine protease